MSRSKGGRSRKYVYVYITSGRYRVYPVAREVYGFDNDTKTLERGNEGKVWNSIDRKVAGVIRSSYES